MSSPSRFAKPVARVLLFLSLVCAPTARTEQVKNLKPQGYVNDFAGVLSAAAKEKLTALCAEVEQKTKAQIAIVTVSSLEGEPIEQYSIDLATAWGIGPKQKATGVLILYAPNDRRYRVEVGYGLEGILPDGKVGASGAKPCRSCGKMIIAARSYWSPSGSLKSLRRTRRSRWILFPGPRLFLLNPIVLCFRCRASFGF